MYPHEVVTVEISVPSSSGKSLQPSTDRGRLARAHISVPSSSGKSLQRIGSYRRRAGASISVPSSSGKSLQRLAAGTYCVELTNFSPLFIGEITSTPSRNGFVEPGFISVPSSSGKSLQPTKSSTHFRLLSISVPSSSGKSLQHDLEFLTGEQWPDFSPLFIGEITSTRCATHQTTTILRFQSPLHRGNHFNVRLSCSPIRNPGISVPSSSGKSLQRRRWPWRWSYRPPFQSPLHRGNHFNSAVAFSAPVVFKFQSPLHRGNHFNAAALAKAQAEITFQSPLHRGNHFNSWGDT